MWSRLNVKKSHIHEQSSPGTICLQESRLSSRSSRPQGRSTRFLYSWMRNSFRCKNTLLDQPSDHLQTSWPSLEQIDHLEHADQPRPSWPPSPSQRWSELRWWEGQALRSPLSSKPPQSRLKLLSLLRLTWIAVLKNVNFCTIYTPLNVTNWKNSKLICLFHIPDWPDNSTSRGPAGKRTKNSSWKQDGS